jgi:acyl-coenzyme A synthetase/AMP-(fatty) acid ligase
MKMNPLPIEDHLKTFLSGPMDPKMIYVDGVTYQEVYDLAAWLARWLRKNVSGFKTVLLCADNKAVIMAALLAAMMERKTLILPNTLSGNGLEELKYTIDFSYAIMDKLRPLPEGIESIIAPRPPLPPFQPEFDLTIDPDIVWVQLYTGGSTAAPKIWNKTIRNLMGEAFFLSCYFDVTPRDRIVATVPAYHIYGLLYSILMPFVASAFVFGDIPYYPKEIIQAVRTQNATILISVPPHYRSLVGYCLESETLRLAFSSAGMLTDDDGRAFTRNNRVDVVEIYGSTETGGIAARIRAKGETAFTPFECVAVKIKRGYLWVQSDFLSPGLGGLDSNFFKLGDRVEASQNGQFMLLGRSGGIIKVGGKRVDMETIRQILLEQKGVTDAVTFSLPVSNGRENQIVAVVEGMADTADLSKRLALVLEPYARPRSIKIIDKMPFTRAGKYDRSVLETLFNNVIL